MRHAALLALALIAATLVASSIALRADTYPRQAGIDAQHYAFRLALLTTDTNEISGEAQVRLRVTRPDVREAALDLVTPMAGGKGMTVTSVAAMGKPVTFVHEND